MFSRRSLNRLTLFERFLTLFTSVRPGEGASVRFLFFCAFLLTFAFYLLKPVREALLLSGSEAELAAYLDGAVALILIFLIPLYKQLYRNLADSEARSRILRWVTAFFLSNLLIFFLLARSDFDVSVPFYIWLSIFNVMVVAQFWAFAADIFNIKTGERLFVAIVVGASLGGWAGAQLAEELSLVLPPHGMMLVAAALLVGPILMSIAAERRVPEGSENADGQEEKPAFGGFRDLAGGFDVVLRSHYLTLVAAFILLLNLVGSLGNYLLRSMVKDRADLLAQDPEALVSSSEYILRFYGDYNAWIAILGLALQLVVVSRVFRSVGVRGALLVLPAFIMVQFGALALIPAFALLRATMIGQNALLYSLQNTINQALYLPLTREEKYVGKTTIETFFVRLGDFAQGLVVFLGHQLVGLGLRGFIVLTAVLSLAMLTTAYRLRGSHRRVVEEKLSNTPPQMAMPMPDVFVPAGRFLMFDIPEESFVDPDPGDTLEFSACLSDGAVLPPWIAFDRYNHTFTVRPPPGSEGTLRIQVTASDFYGYCASGQFMLKWGAGSLHQFRLGTQEDAAPVLDRPSAEAHPAA